METKYSIMVVMLAFGLMFVATVFKATVGADVTATAQVSNSPPIASGVSLNSDIDITLAANTTTEVLGEVTISDLNGCTQLSSVTAVLYRTNVTGGYAASDNNRTHYSVTCDSEGDCLPEDDTTESYVCNFTMLFYADATDLGSRYDGTSWTFNVTPYDSGGAGVSAYIQQEVLTTAAMSVPDSSLSFGELALDANTTDVNQNTTIVNLGNGVLDVDIKGYAKSDGDGLCMNCTIGSIDVANIEYSTTNFTYGAGTDLSQVDITLALQLDWGSDATPRPEGEIYYGLGFPANGISGTCNGTIVLTATEG